MFSFLWQKFEVKQKSEGKRRLCLHAATKAFEFFGIYMHGFKQTVNLNSNCRKPPEIVKL